MKKRMLVTTIALVLVIAVALTTSSLAWFSSSSAVTTSQVSFTAASASGTNLVLGDYGKTDLDGYGTTVTLPTGTNFNPVQGEVSFAGDISYSTNKLTFDVNPFYTSTAVVQESGYDVAHQKVTFAKASNDHYLAGGFNFANATRNAIEGGVTANVTITLTPATGDTHTVEGTTGTVNKGFVVYQGGWIGAGQPFDTASTYVVYRSVDIALLASIRIAVCGAADVIKTEGETVSFDATYDDADAKVYAWGEKGVTLGNAGYQLVDGASQYKYVPGDDDALLGTPEAEKTFVYTNATGEYAEINGITYANGEFTFSYTFADTIDDDQAGSIAFVIWMDGWDESALPGVSQGTFKMAFKLTK